MEDRRAAEEERERGGKEVEKREDIEGGELQGVLGRVDQRHRAVGVTVIKKGEQAKGRSKERGRKTR